MIHILMTTYNGEKYLAQQIDSILCQDYSDIKLFINDDCSSDNTEKIILEYKNKFQDKIFYSKNKKNSGSPKFNFMKLLSACKNSNCDYAMFCDQDDVWFPNKISITLAAIKNSEQKYGTNTPILVHTDLVVTDCNLNTISESHEKYANINCKKSALNNLLVQNVVTGCTIFMNKALITKINVPNTYFIMHDWYIALVASCFGYIVYIDKPTVFYRQHHTNAIGINRTNQLKLIFRKTSEFFKKEKNYNTYLQAKSFVDEYKNCLNSEKYSLLSKYTSIPDKQKLIRIFILNKYNFYKHGVLRKILQIIHI